MENGIGSRDFSFFFFLCHSIYSSLDFGEAFTLKAWLVLLCLGRSW